MDEFAGKVAVITGAASGIGLGLSRTAAREGMRVVMADIEAAVLDEAAAEVAALGADTLAVPTDVSDAAAVEALAAAAFDTFGGAHLVCLNAGVFQAGVSWQRTEADWAWVLGVNFWGPIHGVRAFMPRLIEQGEPAHLVITSSMAGMLDGRVLGPVRRVEVRCRGARRVRGARRARAGRRAHRRVVPRARLRRHADRLVRPQPAGRSHRPRPRRRTTSFVAQTLQEMTSTQGRPPDEAAEMVFAGVRAGQFWIPTTESYEALLEPRHAAILARELSSSAQFD